jgi:hypothetical protein
LGQLRRSLGRACLDIAVCVHASDSDRTRAHCCRICHATVSRVSANLWLSLDAFLYRVALLTGPCLALDSGASHSSNSRRILHGLRWINGSTARRSTFDLPVPRCAVIAFLKILVPGSEPKVGLKDPACSRPAWLHARRLGHLTNRSPADRIEMAHPLFANAGKGAPFA